MVLCTPIIVLWLMFNAQSEHLAKYHSKAPPKDSRIEISELKKILEQDPDNYNAWKILGEKYQMNMNYTKAKEAWDKALEMAPTGQEVAWLKEKLTHIKSRHSQD